MLGTGVVSSSGSRMGGGGVAVNMANCSGPGVVTGTGVGVVLGVSEGLGVGVARGLGSGVDFTSGGGGVGCGLTPSLAKEEGWVSVWMKGRSLPCCVGNGS